MSSPGNGGRSCESPLKLDDSLPRSTGFLQCLAVMRSRRAGLCAGNEQATMAVTGLLPPESAVARTHRQRWG